MKDVGTGLENYLNTEKHMTSCDLFVLHLANGTKYYYTNADTNVVYGGNTYRHDQLLIKRQQVKLNATVVVDTMTITVYADGAVNLCSKGITAIMLSLACWVYLAAVWKLRSVAALLWSSQSRRRRRGCRRSFRAASIIHKAHTVQQMAR